MSWARSSTSSSTPCSRPSRRSGRRRGVPTRKALEELLSFLVEQTQAVAAEEERIDGRAPWITTVAGRNPENLMAQAGGRPDRAVALLVEHLDGVAAGVRAHAERVQSGSEADLLRELADGLERHVAALDRSPVGDPDAAS